MSFLVMTPFISTVRLYDDPFGYEQRMRYTAIVTVTHLSDTAVYLSGAHGALSRDTMPKLLAMLKSQGIETVQMERHGKIKTTKL